jgi:hypothetical protein
MWSLLPIIRWRPVVRIAVFRMDVVLLSQEIGEQSGSPWCNWADCTDWEVLDGLRY